MGVVYPAGYTFNFVSDISPDGSWITGWGGTGPIGADENFVVLIPGMGGIFSDGFESGGTSAWSTTVP